MSQHRTVTVRFRYTYFLKRISQSPCPQDVSAIGTGVEFTLALSRKCVRISVITRFEIFISLNQSRLYD